MARNCVWRLVPAALVYAALLGGCAGKDGKDGESGVSSIVQLTPEASGANCPLGGTRIQSGPDANRNGALEPAEVAATQYVCNGPAGADGHDSLLATAPEAAGANCPAGGTRVQSGLDADDDATLDAGEVSSTHYVCNGAAGANGHTTLVATATEAPGTNCPTGGVRVQSGVDANGSSTLDAAEVVLTQFVCNGAAGASGRTALVTTSAEPAGASCPHGGTRLDSGLDADGDGSLEAAEVTATRYLCNGAPGANGLTALVSVTPEPAGASCAAGGTRIDSGLDADADGTLDAAEIAATRYACNGTDGANGADGRSSLVATSPEAPGASCAAGGVRVESGLDADGDAVLDPEEVSATQYVCNGADGTDGRGALLALSPEGAGANCPSGGTRVQSGLDADGDGTLDPAEVSSTQYVCDGADGASGATSLVATAPEPPGASCADGGTRVQAGLDADGDGTLDPAEVATTHYVCNGADGATGATGASALVVTSPEAAGPNCASGGIRVESGVDADASGFLEPAEVTVTQYVCDGADGAPGASSLVTTSQELPGPNCQHGGTRIAAGLDTNGNGTLEPDEATSTQYACNGGPGPASLVAMAPEPPGPNCPHGGTRVDSGLDADGNGVLDPAEVATTQYVCNPDASHPYVASVSPGAGTVGPEAVFCVTFSEPVDPASLDGSLTLAPPGAPPVAATLAYDPAGPTACLDPAFPLDLFGSYTLVAASGIRDLAGNALLPRFTQGYLVAPPMPPNLRVTIDSVTAGPGTVDVAYTVSNTDAGEAGPFTVGFFVDPPFPPGVGAMPDASADLPGLPGFSSVSGTITLAAGATSAVFAYVDVAGVVPESMEWDNLGGVAPALTGPIVAAPATVEESSQLTVTVPVNSVTRCADVLVGTDAAFGGYYLGYVCGNYAGEGTISGTFFVPPGLSGLGTAALWVTLFDQWGWAPPAQYAAFPVTSPPNLMRYDSGTGGWVDSGIPLTFVTITAATRPNLTMTIDSVTPGPGTLEVAYTVRNDGYGDAGPFTVGFFVDPMIPPSVGSPPDATADVAALAVGSSTSGVVAVAAGASSTVVGLADAGGAVSETREDDNLGLPAAAMTGSPVVVPPVVERLGTVTVTVPVNAAARGVEIWIGGDQWIGPGWWLGSASGNFAGEGTISGTFTVPDWVSTGDWTIWVRVSGGAFTTERFYVLRGDVSATHYTVLDPMGGPLDSGIALTPISVLAPTSPNLTVTIDAVTPGAGTVDVAYTVRNGGFGDAGPFTVGFFVDPVTPPAVGAPTDGSADVAGLAVGGSTSGVVTLTAAPGATVLAYVDVTGAVSETNETDNLGRLMPAMTGSPVVVPATVEVAGALTVTVPVNGPVRMVELSLGGEWGGMSWWLGNAWGNDAGQGSITTTVTVPEWIPTGDWSVWVRVGDDSGMAQRFYVPVAYVSAVNYAEVDPMTGTVLGDSGIARTAVTVVPPTSPNLTMTIDSVTPGAGTLDVAYTVRNTGYGDSGPFTVGFFVNPASPPAVGAVADATADVPGLALGSSTSGIVTLTGGATATVLAYADLAGAVPESNETDNVGRLAPAMTGPPVVAPDTVEATGAVTVTVPVNSSARNVELMLGGEWGTSAWFLGNAWGNYGGEGTITGTFTVPGDVPLGTSTLWVRVADEGWATQSFYVPVGFVSPTSYALLDPMTGTVLGDSGIPMTTLTVIPPTSPNLVVRINSVVEGPGTVDVTFTVRNNGYSEAGPSTVGFFVDPAVEPTAGATPDVTFEVGALAVGATAGGTVTLGGSGASDIVAYADVTGAVSETNELDNLARPRPTLMGPIVATPATVDEGTLLTLTIPVNRTTRTVDVYVGHDVASQPLSLGSLWGNYDREGFIGGTVLVPPGTSSWGTASVWVILWDEMHTVGVAYGANAAVSEVSYARAIVTLPTPSWTDSGIPLTFVTIVPATRPNLQATIDQVAPGDPGTVHVTYTVRNVGAGDAGAFTMGFFADPAAVPAAGSIPDASEDVPSLAVGASYTGTVNLPAVGDAALFVYADVLSAVDEQSETDNAAWVVPVPVMTGQPTVSTSTVAVGGTVDVTVPVSSSVRRIEVWVGGLADDSPGFLVGSATGNAAGEGVIQATCAPPPGSAGDWYVWVATFDAYDLTWRGYLSYGPVSTTYYTEYDPGQGGPPAGPTTIPLTALTVTDAM